MLRQTLVCRNIYTTYHKAQQPNIVTKNHEYFNDPQRLYKYKLLYFSLGVDHLPLRRTAVLGAEKHRIRRAAVQTLKMNRDPTGFSQAQNKQVWTWQMRMNYQEWYMQHLHTRNVWAMLRKYPVGGAKISGVIESPYFGYDSYVHRWTREALPAHAKELYPRRKISTK